MYLLHSLFVNRKILYSGLITFIIFIFLIYLRLNIFPTRHSFFSNYSLHYVYTYVYLVYFLVILSRKFNKLNLFSVTILMVYFHGLAFYLKLFFIYLLVFLINKYFFFLKLGT